MPVGVDAVVEIETGHVTLAPVVVFGLVGPKFAVAPAGSPLATTSVTVHVLLLPPTTKVAVPKVAVDPCVIGTEVGAPTLND